MKIRILRKDPSIPLPEYKTPGSVAFDFSAFEDISFLPGEVKLVRTGLVICTPPSHMLMIAGRSSTPLKKGLIVSLGIIDQDYCGPDDELKLSLYNFTDKPVEIKKGDRLAQGLFIPVERAEWEEVSKLDGNSRGGFGSTG